MREAVGSDAQGQVEANRGVRRAGNCGTGHVARPGMKTAFYTKKRTFYQERLGTTIGKTPKNDGFLTVHAQRYHSDPNLSGHALPLGEALPIRHGGARRNALYPQFPYRR